MPGAAARGVTVITVGEGQRSTPVVGLRPDAPRYFVSLQVTLRRIDRELPVPRPAHPGDAGLDLYARVACVLQPGERSAVPTGIAIAVPEGNAALVVPRSGLAARHGIGLVNSPGLIDSGYRGEIQVLLVNHGDQQVVLARGDRIAQLVIVSVPEIDWLEVEQLAHTQRGEEGFGSTGR
jgi:dUTP pyrophosphatase